MSDHRRLSCDSIEVIRANNSLTNARRIIPTNGQRVEVMKIHLDNAGNLNVIDSYGNGYVSIKGQQYEGSIVVTPSHVEQLPALSSHTQVDYSSLSFVLQWEPEVLLLGTGDKLIFPDMRIIKAFHDQGIGCEAMDSAAACRTYNVLVSEGRSVAAIILAS